MKLCCMVVLTIGVSSQPVFAQGQFPETPSQKLIISERAIAMALAEHPPSPPQSSRDSIKNGTIAGAVLGAVAMGGFVGWLCHQLKEPGDPSCWKSVAYAGALGAGAGAAAGAGIDALISRAPGMDTSPRTPLAAPARVAAIPSGRRQ
jgi:hypothetical protein